MAAAVRFVLLLPGADEKRPGGNPLAPDMFDYRASNTFNFFSELNPERRALIRAVQAQMETGQGVAQMLGVPEEGVADAMAINTGIFDAPLMAAIERYGPGVMYTAMEFETLPTGAQRRLLENGIVLSGMFGLLRPDDLIPDYRLPFGASVTGIGAVADYWRDVISTHIDRLVTDRIVWNLLPELHDRAWTDGGTYDRMYRVRFFVDEDGGRRPAGDTSQLVGAFVHFVAERVAETPESLLDWDAPGGFEPEPLAADAGRVANVDYVLYPDWERRRAARHEARREEARPRSAASGEDEPADEE